MPKVQFLGITSLHLFAFLSISLTSLTFLLFVTEIRDLQFSGAAPSNSNLVMNIAGRGCRNFIRVLSMYNQLRKQNNNDTQLRNYNFNFHGALSKQLSNSNRV